MIRRAQCPHCDAAAGPLVDRAGKPWSPYACGGHEAEMDRSVIFRLRLTPSREPESFRAQKKCAGCKRLKPMSEFMYRGKDGKPLERENCLLCERAPAGPALPQEGIA